MIFQKSQMREKKVLCLIQFYTGMFILQVTWTYGLLEVALAGRCPWFWDLGNLLLKLVPGLAEVPEVWGGGRVMLVEGQGCTLAPRPGESIPDGRDENQNSGNVPASCPTCALPSPVAHFCRWYIPILNLRIREPSPLHAAMCRDRIKHDFNILFPSYNYWLHFPHLHHLARMLSCACSSWPLGLHWRCQPALQPSGHIQCMAY